MAVVLMWIDKFGEVVKIDEAHPLAVAQRAKDGGAAHTADTPAPAIRPAASVTPAPDALDGLSFAELRARAKRAGVNTWQMGAEDVRAALRAAAA